MNADGDLRPSLFGWREEISPDMLPSTALHSRLTIVPNHMRPPPKRPAQRQPILTDPGFSPFAKVAATPPDGRLQMKVSTGWRRRVVRGAPRQEIVIGSVITVRPPACHAGGRGLEPRRPRQTKALIQPATVGRRRRG